MVVNSPFLRLADHDLLQKLPWTSNIQVSVTLALLAIGLWFLFDRTWHGLALSSIVGAVGTWVVHLLVKHGLYRYALSSWDIT